MGEDPRSGTLADFLAFIWRHRVLVVGLPTVVTLVTIIAVLVVPVKYTASATLLPQSSSGSGLLSAALSMAGGSLGGLAIPGLSSAESSIQEAILASDRVAELMRDEFDLSTVWKTKGRDRYLRRWFAALSTRTNREGLLIVSITDRDPMLATRLVERLVLVLDEVNRDIRTSQSRRSRVFLEGRVEEVRNRLAAYEDSVATYQSTHRGMAMIPESERVVEAGAALLAQRMRLETEAEILRRTLGPEAPALVAKELEIQVLDKELARLPELNTELGRLLRELKVRERTYVMLNAQLEEARLDEARDIPTVDVLDPPALPEEKTWPMRTYTVLAAMMLSVLAALGLAKVGDSWVEARRRMAADA